jgi:DNA polymerase IV
VQQVGLKYYDEFAQRMPRAEAAAIADAILAHARALAPGTQMTVVGGYRRGSATCQDVDVVLSNPAPGSTLFLARRLVARLEDHGLVTHVLVLLSGNSKRLQAAGGGGENTPPPNDEDDDAGGGGGDVMTSDSVHGSRPGGFDHLDKALVVWHDPSTASSSSFSSSSSPLHRRVDIIVSPWDTAGCAVLGWTGGTTFERDVRRFCRERGLRFGSDGVRDLARGRRRVDVERAASGGGAARTMDEAERRVFEAIGLEYRPPEERCTG